EAVDAAMPVEHGARRRGVLAGLNDDVVVRQPAERLQVAVIERVNPPCDRLPVGRRARPSVITPLPARGHPPSSPASGATVPEIGDVARRLDVFQLKVALADGDRYEMRPRVRVDALHRVADMRS